MKNNSKHPSPKKLFFSTNNLIRTEHAIGNTFGGGWHFHQEYELVLITKSFGTVLIGDNVSSYTENELYFLGGNLPHTWLSDKTYNAFEAEALVLQFKAELFSTSFTEQPEYVLLKQLLQKSESGVCFPKRTGISIRPLFEKLLTSEGINRMIIILKILDLCSKEKNYNLMASEGFADSFIQPSDEKLKRIISFIEMNYERKIKLDEIANMANMQTNAFCRFFKQKTNCSLFDFINRVRINNACRLLLKGDLPIQEICYLSGFNSTSNFITQFRKKTNKTPKEYRNFYLNKLKHR